MTPRRLPLAAPFDDSPDEGARVSVVALRFGFVDFGENAGHPVVFVDLAGCNLWDGRTFAREEGAAPCVRYCDATITGGRLRSWHSVLASAEETVSKAGSVHRWIWLGGGEPLLQITEDMIDDAHAAGWHLAVETNGNASPLPGVAEKIDHLIVSPKPGLAINLPQAAARVVAEVRVVLPGSDDSAEDWLDRDLDALAMVFPRATFYACPLDLPLDLDVSATVLNPGENEIDEIAEAGFRKVLAQCSRVVAARAGWRLGLPVRKVFRG